MSVARTLWYKVRGTAVGFLKLLRGYLAAIVAFLLVFGAAAYLMMGGL